MLTKGDDFPLHQSAEPIAFAGTDRNFYDRYFFNGYAPDGSVFFAAAMGFYPQLGIVDAAFSVIVDGVQHILRTSRRSDGERLDLSVGPIEIAIDAPLDILTLRIAANDGLLAGELRFSGRHFPILEPRFTRRNGTRLFMDYTRMTQNGRWSGWLSVGGRRIDIGDGWARATAAGASAPSAQASHSRHRKAISRSSSGCGRRATSPNVRFSFTAMTMPRDSRGTAARSS
jgi:hypothetical protein